MLNGSTADRLFFQQFFCYHFDRGQVHFVIESMLGLVQQPLLKLFKLTFIPGSGTPQQLAYFTKILSSAKLTILLCKPGFCNHSRVQDHDFVFEPILVGLVLPF